MCIIVHKPVGVDIDEAVLSQCYASNSDGWGFAVYDDKEVVVEKDMTPFDDFMKRFSQYKHNGVVLHFRIASVGSRKVENCHPFELVKGVRLFHNGTLSAYKDGDKTDSEVFGTQVLTPLVKRYGKEVLEDNIVKELIEEHIGGSKLVLMSPMPIIYNKDKGVDDKGCWFSNLSYKVVKITASSGGYNFGGICYDLSTTKPKWAPYPRNEDESKQGTAFWDIHGEPNLWEEFVNSKSNFEGAKAFRVAISGNTSELLTIGGKVRARIIAHFKWVGSNGSAAYGLVLHCFNARHEWGGDIAIRLVDYDTRTLFDIGDLKLRRLSVKTPSEVVQRDIIKYFADNLWEGLKNE